MRRLMLAVLTAIAALAVLLTGSQFIDTARAATNLAVHVHDNYYHPAGGFANPGPGTNHGLAQASCELQNPAPACDAHIFVGDTITWVAPSPFATVVHTVTECTDNTFSVCGAGSDPLNPIENSGPRQPPMPGPSGWPYGPIVFNTAGTYYYRCEIHPSSMRGRVVVAEAPPVGGAVDVLGGGIGGDSAMMSLLGAGAVAVLLVSTGGVFAVQRLRRRTERD